MGLQVVVVSHKLGPEGVNFGQVLGIFYEGVLQPVKLCIVIF